MNFPRRTVRVGECIACVHEYGPRKGEPFKTRRLSIRVDGLMWKSNRLSWHLNFGPIPRTPPTQKDGLILHTCDMDWCINPEHLYMGTQRQNIQDIYDRKPETRSKMSASHKGKVQSEETKAKRIASLRGRKHTPEARAKISLALIGNTRNLGKRKKHVS